MLNENERAALIQSLNPRQAEALLYDWEFWARPKQLAPPGTWFIWMLMAGRGFGKTRVGVEWIRQQAERHAGCRIALVGRTAADVRDVMVEGESGILAVSPRSFMPKYKPSMRRLVWPNGSMATTYSGDEPAQVRGPQHHYAWGDEVAEWKKPEALENLLLGLRLGNDPRCVLTMTPKPVKHVKELLKDKTGRVALTLGTTYENRVNLADTFFREIVSKYAGTRVGRREIEAILDEDVEGALWKRALIDEMRVTATPPLEEIVVGVDPAVTAGADSAETGIVVVGRGADQHGYVLDDGSLQGTPKAWADQAVTMYHKYKANYIVAEANNGGDLVRENILASDRTIRVKLVRATRGKFTRAEPISTLYERNQVHHVGSFAWLEDQMCNFVPGADSPDRMDALVWAVAALLLPKDKDQGAETFAMDYSGLYSSNTPR